jgi:hypothetical protein
MPRGTGRLTRHAKEMSRDHNDARYAAPPGGQPRLAVGSWRVDPAQSHASFAASVVGRPVRGRLPLSGGVLITEPIEDSTGGACGARAFLGEFPWQATRSFEQPRLRAGPTLSGHATALGGAEPPDRRLRNFNSDGRG